MKGSIQPYNFKTQAVFSWLLGQILTDEYWIEALTPETQVSLDSSLAFWIVALDVIVPIIPDLVAVNGFLCVYTPTEAKFWPIQICMVYLYVFVSNYVYLCTL